MTDQVLHLLVPGLRGPLPAAAAVPGAQAPTTIERWLARADTSPVAADPDALLFDLYGLDRPPHGADLPTAPLCYLADTGERPAGVVYHADPVHLRPDQDRLLLFDAPATNLDAAQSGALIATLNDHLAADGWRLSAPVPGRWYLHLDAPLALRTRPLGHVLGRNVDHFLPVGDDARTVRARLTELQMLLHDHPVNLELEAAGKPAVSGIWLHGGGMLPSAAPRGYALKGEPTPLLRGLQELAEGPVAGRLHWLESARRAVWDADPLAWWQAVAQAEAVLRDSLVARTMLYPGDGCTYRWHGFAPWRLWRRRRPLVDHLLPQDTD